MLAHDRGTVEVGPPPIRPVPTLAASVPVATGRDERSLAFRERS